MKFSENGYVTSKKPHACGGNLWKILRLGADVKLKCLKCGRIVFMSVDQTVKMAKSCRDGDDDAENQR